jgi:geranylgeranyl pyrophosphate synthase
MSRLDEFFVDVKAAVDRRLDELIPAAEAPPVRLHEAIRWSVFAGGKRFRPAILLAVGESFGSSRDRLITAAAAVEMIHTYSLIHDDLPSMDDDDLRRGRATCHVKYGEATAILAGDALQALAFQAISNDQLLSTDVRVELLSILTAAAGTPHGMVAGQQRDLDGEGTDLSIDAVTDIHRGKTGAMITASALAGAIIAGRDVRTRSAVQRFGENLGLLFQIADDMLDLTQETAVLGKTAGKDATAKKATYPSIYGVERAREIAQTVLDEAKDAVAEFGVDSFLLVEIAEFVLQRES